MTVSNPNERRTLGLSLDAGQALHLFTSLPSQLGATELQGVDYLVIRDVIGDRGSDDYHALLVASFAAARLKGVGLVPEVDLYRADPYLIARALTSLDILSNGRAGLLALGAPQGVQDVGYATTPEDETFLAEFFEVIGKLWNSWETGAVARRWDENLYLDRTLLRDANHNGRFFAVRGSLPTPRAVQERPVLFVRDHPLHAAIRADAAGVMSSGSPSQGRWIQCVDAAGVAASGLAEEAAGHLVEVPPAIERWSDLVALVQGLPLPSGKDAAGRPTQLGDLFPSYSLAPREQEARHV